MTPPADHSVESAGRGFVARLFLAFGLLGGAVVVTGFVLSLIEGTLDAAHPWPEPEPVWRDLQELRSAGIIELGLVLLLLLPVVRNAAVVYVLLRRRQHRAALLALLGLFAMAALYVMLSLRAAALPDP